MKRKGVAKSGLSRLREVAGIFFFCSWEVLEGKFPKPVLTFFSLFFRRWKWLLELPPPIRLRKGFETLGSAYLKLGQLLSTRVDILPAEFVKELEKLQDRVPPLPLAVFKDKYGKLFSEFREIDEIPIGSGSVAQVHRAVLKNGKEVAVKFLRPEAESSIKRDIFLLKRVIRFASLFLFPVREFKILSIVEEFERMLLEELDLSAEAAYMEQFRRFSEKEPALFVPAVFWDLSDDSVLVTEFIRGRKLTELAELSEEERKELAEKFVHIVHRTIFELGTFHGDLHPGNIFVLPDGRIGFVDFGIVGRLPPETLYEFFVFSFGVMNKDPDVIVSSLKRIGAVPEEADEKLLKREILRFLDKYYNQPLSKIDAERLFYEELSTARRFKIVLPEDLVILMKTIAHTESIARLLYPEFRLPPLLKPYLKKVAPLRLLKEVKRRVYLTAQAYGSVFEELPRILKRRKKERSGFIREAAILGSAVVLALSPKLLPLYLLSLFVLVKVEEK